MEKLILNQLDKNLKKLKQISIEVENYPQYDQKQLIDILFDNYQFVVSKEKPLNVFVKALEEYMNSDVNQNFKLTLLNDINEKLDKYEKAGIIIYPDSLDWKSIHNFKEEVSKILISNAGYVDFAKEIKDIYDPVQNILFLQKYPKHQIKIAQNITKYFIAQINAELVIPFFNYQVKYTWDLKRKPEHNFKKVELDEYIQSWIDLQVTYEDWLKFHNISVFEHLEEYNLPDEKLDEIRQHRFNLFNAVVNNVFNNHYKEPFQKIQLAEAHETAKRDLTLINLLISGDINEANQKRVEKVFRIKDWQKAVLQFEDLFRNKYSYENNYDIYHEDSFLYTSALLKYKNYIEQFLNKKEDTTLKPTSKIKSTKEQAFIYTGELDKLKNTLDALHKANAISNDIKMTQFKKLFSGNEEIKEPVPWLMAKGDLMVFIQTIIQTPKFKCPDKQQWNIAAKCFTKPDGTPFTPNELKVKPTLNIETFIKAGRNLN